MRTPRVPVREQDAKLRAKNFAEVSYGYNEQEAMAEASRCLNCKVPKCIAACPVGIKIPDFIGRIAGGDFYGAYKVISEDSSIPAICGRVCPQETQCEGACILGVRGEPVSIGCLERFVADYNRSKGVRFTQTAPSNGIKVAVIGSGPAGLACASDLAKMGYSVTIFDSLHKAGGVLTYGIPEFRLPKKEVVEEEIENLCLMGIKIETNVYVGRSVTIAQLMEKENFRAVFIGTGAGLPLFLGVEGENLSGVFSANEFLTRNNLMGAFDPHSDTPIYRGKRVCVVGGGNVAMDAARTALRLGSQVKIIYRRSQKELPARAEEVKHAMEEGIEFMLLTNPTKIIGDKEGNVRALRCVKMELGEPDESGRRAPIPIEGSEFDIETDVVIPALGTRISGIIAETTPGLVTDKRGRIVTDENCATSCPGVFAGGDTVTGSATVILAMGDGRKAARSIDNYIKEKFKNQKDG